MNIGDIINGYNVLKPLGDGGAGIVYEVQKDGIHYALKECIELDNESLKRFSRELRIIKTLNSSNIIKIYDEDLSCNNPYYIMEICDTSLDKAIKKGLSKDQKFKYFLQACNGFAELHNNGIIHRDIKPGNVLIVKDKVKISDFGLGKFEKRDTTTITTEITSKGTPGFMAPEISNEGHFKDADARSDIFSIGVLLYNLFSDGMMPDPINANSIPKDILYIVRKCMDIAPDKRYQRVEEIISDVIIIRNLEKDYMSMKSLVEDKGNLSESVFLKRALTFLLKTEDLADLVDNLKCLKIQTFRRISKNSVSYLDILSTHIKSIHEEVVHNMISYEDVDIIVSLCEIMFGYPLDNQSKKDLLDVSISLSTCYNRWDCMKAVVRMANSLDDDAIKYLSLFFVEKREFLQTIQDAINMKFKLEIRSIF